MRIHYVSPSELPSRSANAVHVMHMCHALAKLGAQVTLFAKRTIADANALPGVLEDHYGIDSDEIDLVTFHSDISVATNLRIAAMAYRHLLSGTAPDLILSRNLYAAYLIGALNRRRMVFETHQLEQGFRKRLQGAIITRPNVTTVLISERLREAMEQHHHRPPARTLILHDAAPAGIEPLSAAERRTVRTGWGMAIGDGTDTPVVCGYFGHLYPGRGIEVIEAMAAARPTVAFVVFGGNEADITARRAANQLPNLHYMGFLSHRDARTAMGAVDILLMPYQRNVSIGIDGHDTAAWMSPMKMFEYMASGVPCIASRLPALQEVLEDEGNALLADPDDIDAWLTRLDRLNNDPELANRLAQRAHDEYRRTHNWIARARRMLEYAQSHA